MPEMIAVGANSRMAEREPHRGRARLLELRLDRNEPVATADLVGSYPNQVPFLNVLSSHLRVPASQIVLTTGADHAIDVACRAASGEAVLLAPDFPRYTTHVRNAGLRVAAVPVSQEYPEFPIDALLEVVDERTGLVIIGGPESFEPDSLGPER